MPHRTPLPIFNDRRLAYFSREVMQDLTQIDSVEQRIEHAGNTEHRERKPWRTPRGSVVEVAKQTQGPFGIGGDGNSCHS